MSTHKFCEFSNYRPHPQLLDLLVFGWANYFTPIERQRHLPHHGLKNIPAPGHLFAHYPDRQSSSEVPRANLTWRQDLQRPQGFLARCASLFPIIPQAGDSHFPPDRSGQCVEPDEPLCFLESHPQNPSRTVHVGCFLLRVRTGALTNERKVLFSNSGVQPGDPSAHFRSCLP